MPSSLAPLAPHSLRSPAPLDPHQERSLTRHEDVLESHVLGKACGCIKKQYIAASVAPLRVMLGLTMLTMTLLIVGSITASILDQYMYQAPHACAVDHTHKEGGSMASLGCTDAQKKSAGNWHNLGYLMKLSVPHAVPHNLFNPFDSALLYLGENAKPLDVILLAVVIAYSLYATLYGLIRFKFLCLPVYRIRRSATSPRGVLLLSAMMMITALCLLVHLPTLAPQYATFGAQASFSNVQERMEEKMLTEGAKEGAVARSHGGMSANTAKAKAKVVAAAAGKAAMASTESAMGEQCRASLPHAIKGGAIFGALQEAKCGNGAMCCTTQVRGHGHGSSGIDYIAREHFLYQLEKQEREEHSI